ncbi:hypothetical protein J6590_024736 [Homalodisca vitripennis]|nr:hypothetical protein J6590_024736 [Homalodisca vitripennis]
MLAPSTQDVREYRHVPFRNYVPRHERCSALREFFPNYSEATANSVIDVCNVS